MKKTFLPSKSFILKQWYIIDAKNKTLGRLASKIACILRGKNKSYFTPYLDTGDNIIVINSNQIVIDEHNISNNNFHNNNNSYFANKLFLFVIALNSKLLFDWSLKNIVHCSPGRPSNLLCGFNIKLIFLFSNFFANL